MLRLALRGAVIAPLGLDPIRGELTESLGWTEFDDPSFGCTPIEIWSNLFHSGFTVSAPDVVAKTIGNGR
jgi:hypothetical protein